MIKKTSCFVVGLCIAIFIMADSGYGQNVPWNYANNPTSEHWKEIQTPHFKIIFPYHYSAVAEWLAPRAEQVYREFKNELGSAPHKKINLYVNKSNALVSGSRAVDVDEAYSIWVGNPLMPHIIRSQNLTKTLRYEIADAFLKKIRSFPLDYYYYLFSRPRQSPWSDGILSYLSEPYQTPDDISAMRYYWSRKADHKSMKASVRKWKNTSLGRSQIHYFNNNIGKDSLRLMYGSRKHLFGWIPYFDFGPSFRKASGMTYKAFQKQWRMASSKHYAKPSPILNKQNKYFSSYPWSRNFRAYLGGAINRNTDHIAFIGVPEAGGILQKLYVGRTDSTKKKIKSITEGYFHSEMDWNPAGNELVFSKRNGPGLKSALYLWHVSRKQVQRITSHQNAEMPTFSPSGNYLAYIQKKEKKSIIWLQNLTNGSRRKLYAFTLPLSVDWLDYDPKGKDLLISYHRGGKNYTAGILQIKTKKFSSFSIHAKVPLNAHWSSDGKSIYFNREFHGVSNIFSAQVSNGSATRIRPVTSQYRGLTLWNISTDSAGNSQILAKKGEAYSTGKIVTFHPNLFSKNHYSSSSTDNQQSAFLSGGTKNSADASSNTSTHLPVKSYHPFQNIRLQPPFVGPYYFGRNEFGVGGIVQLSEPMRTSRFNFYGGIAVSDFAHKSYFYSDYVNNSLKPRIELNYNHFSSGTFIIGKTRKVKVADIVAARSLWKLTGLSHDHHNWYFGLQLRYMGFDYLSTKALHKGHPHIFYTNRKPHQTDLKADLIWRNLEPNRNLLINPGVGEGARLAVSGSDKILGSDTKYARFNLDGYKIFPAFGHDHIYLYANGVMDFGAPTGRDYLDFSDGGDFELAGADFMGPVDPGVKRFVRGYTTRLLGDKFVFGRLEYRIPFEFDTTKKLFGLIPPARTCFTFFADGGIMGNARISQTKTTTRSRYSAGFEIKRVFSIGNSFRFTYELGIGQPLTKSFGPHPFARAQMAVPF
ncbi:MAG TPA: hypothetical protein VE868_13430 [Balneolaceae bacterium]|nr:hypothetical protein [Balneolaceae bacterium]